MSVAIDKRKVPSLSLKGWVVTIPEKMDKLLNYYFLSDYSQSDWYEIFSLPYHIATKGNRPNEVKALMENDLGQYFQRYFADPEDIAAGQGALPTVECTIIDKSSDGKDISRYEIQTEIIVVVDGKSYSAAKAIQILNSKITILDRLNNG